MSSAKRSGAFRLGDLPVKRLGYGAMQLSGPGVFGPPRDRKTAMAILREAVDRGVNQIDTSDYYGPHVTNQLIYDALHPYPDDLVIVTKVGARRGNDGEVLPAFSPIELVQAVYDNLRRLGLDALPVVNLRNMFGVTEAATHAIQSGLEALTGLQRQGLIRHIGLSSVTAEQVALGRHVCEIVCVQNKYNLAHRHDDALIDVLARDRIAYVPFFPIGGGFTPLQSSTLGTIAQHVGATATQVALAWLLRRASNVLLIPGTSSLVHLRENIGAADLELADDAVNALDALGFSGEPPA
jgi:aryl-alcohol dehydrogenase-like predicted oxidoreductase